MLDNLKPALGSTRFRLFAVIVLYKMNPHDSVSFQSLMACLNAGPRDNLEIEILLYDNTPGGWRSDPLPQGIQYEAALANTGLPDAYNRAIELAQQRGCDWLLTLDQDTDLPLAFLNRIADIGAKIQHISSIAAIVPQIVSGEKVLSPNWFQYGAIARWLPRGFIGIPAQKIFAFNSASTLRIAALNQIGGYEPWFWLDNSDASTFRKLHHYGKCVYVAGDLQVDHDFSMMDLQSKVTPNRYRNILLAETAFWDFEMNTLANLERTARLLVRLYKHFRRKDNPALRKITLQFLNRRLFWSRRRRIAAWKTETLDIAPHLHNVPSPADENISSITGRPKISVCMAAYNGERYIEKQLRSILNQLAENDEIVIVDDASRDNTVASIQALNDRRIHLLQHIKNRGVVVTFEDAIRNATGHLFFLADDDDIWAPDKVERILQAFHDNANVRIVTSQVTLIDEEGRTLNQVAYSHRTPFQTGFWSNVLRNHFQGSAMAFKSSLVRSILPIPKGGRLLHDVWIGTRNAVTGGDSLRIEEPLLYYRRHGTNVSRSLTRSQQIEVRIRLLWAHLRSAF